MKSNILNPKSHHLNNSKWSSKKNDQKKDDAGNDKLRSYFSVPRAQQINLGKLNQYEERSQAVVSVRQLLAKMKDKEKDKKEDEKDKKDV